MKEHSFECQNEEFKSAVKNFRDVSRTACAFANGVGGILRIGIKDDGTVVGIHKEELDDLQLRSTGAVQCISPMPDHEIRVTWIDGKAILEIAISPLPEDTFCSFQGVVYYRSGSSNVRLEGQGLLNFLVDKQISRYDSRYSEAALIDLDMEKLRAYLSWRSPKLDFHDSEVSRYLINLGLIKEKSGLRMRNAAILFFAKEPRAFIPQNVIKLARFSGTEPIRIIDKHFSTGTILENIKEAEAFISRNIRTGFKIEGMFRKDVPEYPSEVIRELLANAVVHRDYFDPNGIQVNIFSDRLEIINPGRLMPGMTLESLGHLSVQRNPLIYRLLQEIGIVEGMAIGIPMMRTVMMDRNLPQPRFEQMGGFFKATLYNHDGAAQAELNERQQKASAVLKEKGSITTGQYMEMNLVSRPTAFRELSAMKDKGLASVKGRGRGTRYEPR
jgi:ATP-dependent DNA helicase RecG